MAPVVRISEATYEKLQRLAKPFTDTPDSVISRCVDLVLAAQGDSMESSPLDDRKVIELDAANPGELKHTRVRVARFGKEAVPRANWNALLRTAHSTALEGLGSFSELARATRANIRKGRYEDEGFHYLPEADISVQGQDSNLCWENSLTLAQRLRVPIGVEFQWHNKEGAAHPGMRGEINWAPGT